MAANFGSFDVEIAFGRLMQESGFRGLNGTQIKKSFVSIRVHSRLI